MATFGTVSDEGDSVIEGGSAFGAVEHSGGVRLEDSLVGLDGDRDGLDRELSLEGKLGFNSHGDEAGGVEVGDWLSDSQRGNAA